MLDWITKLITSDLAQLSYSRSKLPGLILGGNFYLYRAFILFLHASYNTEMCNQFQCKCDSCLSHFRCFVLEKN